jgi:NAD(P)H-hydrate epimerase
MPIILNREQSRRVDRIAIDEYGIPGIVLMENAARGATDVALETLAANRAGPVAVVCGGGNNGGDGYAIARLLHNRGCAVNVVAVGDPQRLGGDAAINFRIVEKMKLPRVDVLDASALPQLAAACANARLIVDAILGTGFSGALKPHLAAVIGALNEVAARNAIPVLAVDVPSGLDCETGLSSEPTVRAARTVTFAALKTGFENPRAQEFLGVVSVADIGVPPEILALAQQSRS